MTTLQVVRALAQAQPQHKELFSRVQKLKAAADQPHVETETRDEVTQLELHLDRVLKMEEELLKHQKVDIKKQIEHHLKTDKNELAKKIDRIEFMLADMSAKLHAVTRARSHHETRKKQLDKKVQQVVTKNENIQEKIDDLERKVEMSK